MVPSNPRRRHSPVRPSCWTLSSALAVSAVACSAPSDSANSSSDTQGQSEQVTATPTGPCGERFEPVAPQILRAGVDPGYYPQTISTSVLCFAHQRQRPHALAVGRLQRGDRAKRGRRRRTRCGDGADHRRPQMGRLSRLGRRLDHVDPRSRVDPVRRHVDLETRRPIRGVELRQYLWWNIAEAKAYMAKVGAWTQGVGADNVVDGYTISGQATGRNASTVFLGAFAVGPS